MNQQKPTKGQKIRTLRQQISRGYFQYCSRMNKKGCMPDDRQTWENECCEQINQLKRNYQ